ncbi:MAG: carboxylating nicotinate-nucleotide diphosphorylase [Phycisphaeraceae bacterium]|nr:carboxylating nicotinate-nucleotide diphosphorylase [Phycisphaeraceae bacterium]
MRVTWTDYLTVSQAIALIEQAKREDVGPAGLDVTSLLMDEPHRMARAEMRSRKPGRLAGLVLLPWIARAYDAAIDVTPLRHDGDAAAPGDIVARFTGPIASILAMERVALNFVTHLSGIATLTDRYVQAVAGTSARIYDTRKTIPGLRALAKYAVVCGGGFNHRIGLHDAVLVKDNHLAHVPVDQWTRTIARAIAKSLLLTPPPKFFEVEVDSLEQLAMVLLCRVDIALLDNMTTKQMRQAVTMRDEAAARTGHRVELEASGGVNMDTVTDIARTGVDRIAVGALTHSAPCLDLGLDIGA